MTIDEAINKLNWALDNNTIENVQSAYEYIEAVEMAIKALEQEPCEDAISRVEALKAIEKEKQGWEGAERYAIDECHSRIAELPSVTPQLKTGHWETSGDYFTGAYETIDYVRCSCCGYDSLEEGDYCPNCGARMEESEE